MRERVLFEFLGLFCYSLIHGKGGVHFWSVLVDRRVNQNDVARFI